MLVIRNEQIQQFIAANEDELVSVVVQSVRAACPDRVAAFDDDKFAAAIRIGIDRARTHGLANAEDIAAFIAVMFQVAPRFDEQTEIRGLLEETILPPATRFYMMIERASDKAWVEAQRRYEDSFWFPDAAAGA